MDKNVDAWLFVIYILLRRFKIIFVWGDFAFLESIKNAKMHVTVERE